MPDTIISDTQVRLELGWAQSQVFQSPARFKVLCAGRRFGKTWLSAAIALDKTVGRAKREGKKGLICHYIAPTYGQAKDPAWAVFKSLSRPFWSAKPHETELRIHLENDCQIVMKGSDRPENMRGPGIDYAILDEAATMKLDAVWNEIVRPMLADRQGGALMISSPDGYNTFKEFYDKAASRPDWERWIFTTLDGGNVPLEEALKSLEDTDIVSFRQEYLATFETTGEGLVYYAFTDANIADTAIDFNPYAPIILSMDFNVNPLCAVICQKHDMEVVSGTSRYNPVVPSYGGRIQVLSEIFIKGSGGFTPMLMAEFHRKVQKWNLQLHKPMEVYIYGDASMSNRHTSANMTDHDHILQWFQENRYNDNGYILHDHVPTSNPLVRTRVSAVNSMLQAASGRRGLLVDPRCTELIADFRKVRWSDGTGQVEDQKTDKDRTHLSAALGYYLYQISKYALNEQTRYVTSSPVE